MNQNLSLNTGLKCKNLIKVDDIITDETNKILKKNKIINEYEGNFNSSLNKKKINKNFLRKKIIKENNNCKNGQKDEQFLPDDLSKNHIFQYYYSTIEYMKKYFNSYINSDDNNISKNNTININKFYSYDKNINNVSYIKTSNINKNNYINNNFCINEDKKINFNYNIYKDENDNNKTSGSSKKLDRKDTKKINAFSKEVITNHNLNSNFEQKNEINVGGFQNLIININCPSFKPSNFNNKENNNFNSESKTKQNKIENKNTSKENGLAEEEYYTQMFGKKGWICVLCNNFNFETRVMCNRCKALKNPKKIVNIKNKINSWINQNNDDENKDWICSKCQNFNYSFRTICNRCKVPKIYQFVVKPVLYQNIIYNNIIAYSPILAPSYFILNHTPNTQSSKIAQ